MRRCERRGSRGRRLGVEEHPGPVHPSLEYALICCGAVARPRDRDVHAVATPRLGGLALFAGFAMAIVLAHQLPTLRATFANWDIDWVLVAGAIICAIGVLDDKYA